MSECGNDDDVFPPPPFFLTTYNGTDERDGIMHDLI